VGVADTRRTSHVFARAAFLAAIGDHPQAFLGDSRKVT
jgi:hypothetical protein